MLNSTVESSALITHVHSAIFLYCEGHPGENRNIGASLVDAAPPQAPVTETEYYSHKKLIPPLFIDMLLLLVFMYGFYA